MANQSTTDEIFNVSTEANVAAEILHTAVSKAEPVILTAYLLLCLTAVFVGNGVLFTPVYKNRALHTQHFGLLISMSVCDIVTCITLYPLVVMVLFQSSDVSELACRVMTFLGISAFSTTVYILGLLAYERYHFFCRPLTYETFFTRFRLSCMVTAAWIFPLGCYIVAEVFIGRKLSFALLTCRLNSSKLVVMIQIATLATPSLLMILWSTVQVGVTWAKMRVKIAPQVLLEQGNIVPGAYLPIEALSNTYRAKTRKVGAAFKLIILVSGFFWGTYLPLLVAEILVIINHKGVAWEEIETGQNIEAVLVLRYRNVLAGTVSQVLNPLLYLYTHPELRAAVKRLMSRRSSSQGVNVSTVI